MKIKNKITVFILTISILILLFSLINNYKVKNNDVFYNKSTEITKKEVDNNTQLENIHVDIKGSIHQPGLYKLNPESRLNDLITLAGGFNQANELCYNLAQKINDGTQIIIKSHDEACESSSLININTATHDELIRIKGIGPGRADSIIEHRNNNGMFDSIEDIKNVSGIGDATFEKLKEQITI